MRTVSSLFVSMKKFAMSDVVQFQCDARASMMVQMPEVARHTTQLQTISGGGFHDETGLAHAGVTTVVLVTPSRLAARALITG